MTGKTHQIIGISTGLVIYLNLTEPVYSPVNFATVTIGSYFMSLLPDLDRHEAKFWQSIPYGKAFGKIVDPFIKHRNFSHSIIGVLIFGWLLWQVLQIIPLYWGIDKTIVFAPMMGAYISHLMFDLITVEGIPLLFPYGVMLGFPPKPLHGIRVLTGKWFENLVIFPLANLVLLIIIFIYWSNIKSILFK